MRQDGLNKFKNPVTLLGMEPATFRIVAGNDWLLNIKRREKTFFT
jgi:hypothetical protein